MTTRSDQLTRYWPTSLALAVLAATHPASGVEQVLDDIPGSPDDDDFDPCPPACERSGFCVRSCTPLLIDLED